jgi:hypothetical protein
MADNKEELYRRIRVGGFATFIPFVLISGPIGGYLVGEFLRQKFCLGRNTILICIAIGAVASFLETFRIIRAMVKVDKM